MGLLDKLFGGSKSGSGLDVDTAVSRLFEFYDDPEVKSDSGLPITGRHAEQVRAIGRDVHKAGGKESMEATRDRFRERLPWAGNNLEAIWSSLPEWRN